MTSFDSWEDRIRPSGDCLMHFGTKGMKHGRRRYQNEDGTWTETGLAARRKREGFGERRAAKKAAKAAKKAERKERKATRKAEVAEQRRQKNIKLLTDDELKARIARLELENKYKDLNKNRAVEAGKELLSKYFDYKDKAEQRKSDLNKQRIELERLITQKIQAREATKKSKYDAKSAASEAKKKASDVRGGLKIERKAQLKNAKTNYRNTTIWGSIGKRANNRAKYIQEERMNPIEVKKHQRTKELQQLQIEREKAKRSDEENKKKKK